AAPLSSQQHQPAYDPKAPATICEVQLDALRRELCARGSAISYEITTDESRNDLRDELSCYAYPDFGLYLLRSRRMYLSIRCGSFGLVGNGSHAHHDQLSIEFCLDGRNLILDPGTYLYTPLKHRREEYRRAQAHFAPHVLGRAAQGTGPGLFQM